MLTKIHHHIITIFENVEHPKLWAILSAIGLFFSNYVFHQWGFAIGFMIIMIMDTFSGVYIAIRTGTYSSQALRSKLMDKSVAYFSIILSFSAGTKIMLEESDINLIQYLNIPFYSLFIAAELRSVIHKWYVFKGWKWLGDLMHLLERKK